MRIWLPDAPGVLGAVAAEIGAVDGNVIGLEVLEREAGVAIDELVVELPDRPGAVDSVCQGIRRVPGAGVEDVRPLASVGQDREDTVLGAAVAILQAASPTAALDALLGQLLTLFDLSWMALADLDRERFLEVRGAATSHRPMGEWRSRRGRGSGNGPGQRHHELRGLRRARAGYRLHPLRGADRPRSGAAQTSRDRSGWSRWRRGLGRRPRQRTREQHDVTSPPCCVSGSSDRASSRGRTRSGSRP